MTTDNTLLERVRKLLAKAEAAGVTPAEASVISRSGGIWPGHPRGEAVRHVRHGVPADGSVIALERAGAHARGFAAG